MKKFWTVDERHIHEIGGGPELAQVLGEELDDPDFPSIQDEMKLEKNDTESAESEIQNGDQGPSPTQMRDQPLLCSQTAPQLPSPLPLADKNHELSNGSTEAAFLVDAETENLAPGCHGSFIELTTERGFEVSEEEEDEQLECFEQKFAAGISSPLLDHADDLVNTKTDEVEKVPSKSELMPVIKIERCDDMLAADAYHKLNVGTLEGDGNSISRKRDRPRNAESLWNVCQQKIKKARLVKAKPKAAVLPPISELEQFDYYQKKHLCKEKIEKRKAILEEDGKKEHTIENLLFLRNVERRKGMRRSVLNAPPPKVECQLCHESLSRKKSDHAFLVHGPDYRNTCPVCLEKNMSNLEAHFRTAHFNDAPLSCHMCSTVCYSGKELRKHVVCHQTMDPLTCAVCEFDFASKAELDAHRIHHKVTNKGRVVKVTKEKKPKPPMDLEGTCETCGYLCRARSETELRSRIRIHHRQKHSEKLKCPLCDRTFSLYSRLSKHCLSAHTPEDHRPFICPFENCGKGFKTNDNLKAHQTYHKPPRFKCDKCHKNFFWAEVWRKHKCPAS